MDQVIDHINQMNFKFEEFMDPDWYPTGFRIFDRDRLDLGISRGSYEYDLENNTITLSSNMPDFLNALILVKFAAFSFHHQVIRGSKRNTPSLPDLASTIVLRQLVRALVSDLVKNGSDHFSKGQGEYVRNLVHLTFVGGHALWGRVFSTDRRPGVLSSKRYALYRRAFMNGRDAFIIGAYLLFGWRFVGKTDQPRFETKSSLKEVKMLTTSTAIFNVAKPILMSFGSSLISLTVIFILFGNFFSNLDLTFIADWAISILNVLKQIPYLGDVVATLSSLAVNLYQGSKHSPRHFFKCSTLTLHRSKIS